MTRMIAGVTPEWQDYDVYLNGVHEELAFEADDQAGKVWVESTNIFGYEVLRGRVEFRKKTPQLTQQSTVSGNLIQADDIQCDTIQYSGILYDLNNISCDNPMCEACHPRTVTVNITADATKLNNQLEQTILWLKDLGIIQ